MGLRPVLLLITTFQRARIPPQRHPVPSHLAGSGPPRLQNAEMGCAESRSEQFGASRYLAHGGGQLVSATSIDPCELLAGATKAPRNRARPRDRFGRQVAEGWGGYEDVHGNVYLYKYDSAPGAAPRTLACTLAFAHSSWPSPNMTPFASQPRSKMSTLCHHGRIPESGADLKITNGQR